MISRGYKKLNFNTQDFENLTVSKLKRLADYWLRKYLLNNSDIKGGKIFCPIKMRWFPVEQMHVAHFIDRGNMGTRYDLNNCHLISKESNCFDSTVLVDGYKSKHHMDYENYLIGLIGDDSVKNLKLKSCSLELYSREDYIERINFFKNDCGKQ